MLIALGSQKGGVGKTTLAFSCAAALARDGQRTALVDLDPQGTATAWASYRADRPELPAVHCLGRAPQLDASTLLELLQRLRSRYARVVVDTAGAYREELAVALASADVFVAPVGPSLSDLLTAPKIFELVQRASARGFTARAVFAITRAPTHPWSDAVAEARRYLARYAPLPVLETVVHERNAYRTAMAEGRGVTETTDRKAAAELAAALEEIAAHASRVTTAA